MLNKTIKVKRTRGRNGNPVLTIEHICGDYTEFSPEELRDLSNTLMKITLETAGGLIRNGETREYEIRECKI
jgi:hypothetical protein